jgi:hypothetical protein
MQEHEQIQATQIQVPQVRLLQALAIAVFLAELQSAGLVHASVFETR